MSKTSILRTMLLMFIVGSPLTFVGLSGRLPFASAADLAPGKDYVAIFRRGSNDQPIAIIEKPRDGGTGNGSNVEVDAFGLRTATIDAAQAKTLQKRLPELDGTESRKLPPGFRLYADERYVEVSYAGASQKYRIVISDPADITGTGGGGEGGNGGGGGSGAAGGSM